MPLPLPDPASERLRAVAAAILPLQQAVHGAHLDGIAQGRFVLLNQPFDFGGIDRVSWRGEFREGNNPLRRMTLAYFGWAVPLLARGQAAELEIVRKLLVSLEAQNPFRVAGVFRDVWNAYAASHRLINLLSGLALHRAAGGTPDPGAERMILDHARFCAGFVSVHRERDLQYNHLMKNLVAMAVYCAGLPAVPPAFGFLRDAVPRSIFQNVLADGGHAERSPMYHALAMIDIAVLRATGLYADGWGPQLDDAAARMRAALAVMSHPDGDIALFNDAWLGEAPPAAALIDGVVAPATARLPVTGYARIAEGGDAVILDCGPCGPDDNPGHAHADFLSVEASFGGRRMIVDTGVPTYTAGAARDRSRSAASHNAPHLDGVEPIEFWKSFRVGRRGTATELADRRLAGIAPLWCAGRHSGYAHVGVEMRRWVGLWPGQGVLICDIGLGRKHRAQSCHFLVDGGWSAERSAAAATFGCDGLVLHARTPAGRLRDVRPARYWPRFGVEAPAHLMVVYPEDAGPYRRAALWLGRSETVPLGVSALAALFDRLAEG